MFLLWQHDSSSCLFSVPPDSIARKIAYTFSLRHQIHKKIMAFFFPSSSYQLVHHGKKKEFPKESFRPDQANNFKTCPKTNRPRKVHRCCVPAVSKILSSHGHPVWILPLAQNPQPLIIFGKFWVWHSCGDAHQIPNWCSSLSNKAPLKCCVLPKIR